MNISDIGPLGSDALGRGRDISGKEKTDDRARVSDTGEHSRLNPQQAGEAREAAPRDVFRTSDDRRRIEELARAVDEAGNEPRRDLVERARERAASGYYNSPDFLGRLALRIVNNGLNE